MNKKHMDFAPRKANRVATGGGVGAAKAVSAARGSSTVRSTKVKVMSSDGVVRKASTGAPRARASSVHSGSPSKKTVNFGVVEEVTSAGPTTATAGKKVMTIPQSPFINQAKVEKRPLSKNVYKKNIKATEEPKTGPVTIISKPEKDKHAGLIAAIIITIILGAAAGTVAFLLLPK